MQTDLKLIGSHQRSTENFLWCLQILSKHSSYEIRIVRVSKSPFVISYVAQLLHKVPTVPCRTLLTIGWNFWCRKFYTA